MPDIFGRGRWGMEGAVPLWQVASLLGIAAWVLVSTRIGLTRKMRSLVQPWVTRRVLADTILILGVQRLSHGFLDVFFSVLSCVVSVPFYTGFLPLVFWCGYSKLARQMTLLIAYCDYFGNAIKDLVSAPRPNHPCIRRFTATKDEKEHALEYGLPSSHALNTVCMAGYILYYFVSSSAGEDGITMLILFLLFVLAVSLVSIARIYLGMHSVVDVLAGIVLGLVSLAFWIAIHDYIDDFVIHGHNVTPFWAGLAFLLCFAYPVPEHPTPSFDYHTAFNGVAFGIMDPGPIDCSLLQMQASHRSQAVWEGEVHDFLRCRRREATTRREVLHPRVRTWVESAGFKGLLSLEFIQLDWHLITALVERWRPETHTFHMRHGEMTITLEDVNILLGLRVDGEVVTGRTATNVLVRACNELLGRVPEGNELVGPRVHLPWLSQTFSHFPEDGDDELAKMYARAYILQLLAGVLFPDKKGTYAGLMYLPLLRRLDNTVSWGSACLAYLYRELCRASFRDAEEIGGCLILLQLWAWERFPSIAPRVYERPDMTGRPHGFRWRAAFNITQHPTHVVSAYRDAFDAQTTSQVIWRPYEDAMDSLPDYCLDGREIWTSAVPFIHFQIVEHFWPQRVMRQFGGIQIVPTRQHYIEDLHKLSLKGKTDIDWAQYHKQYIDLWNLRAERRLVLRTTPIPACSPDYMDWYHLRTRRFIGRMGSIMTYNSSMLGRIKQLAVDAAPYEEIIEVVTETENVMADNLAQYFSRRVVVEEHENNDLNQEYVPSQPRRKKVTTRRRSNIPESQPPESQLTQVRPNEEDEDAEPSRRGGGASSSRRRPRRDQ